MKYTEPKPSRLRNHKTLVRVSAWCFLLLAAFYPIFSMSEPVLHIGTEGDFEHFVQALKNLTEVQKAFWMIITLVPLLLVPAIMGYYSALKPHASIFSGLMLLCSIVSALAYTVSIARWNVIHLNIATLWNNADIAGKQGLQSLAIFLDDYLGDIYGIYLGEGFMALSLAYLGLAMMQTTRFPRWLISFVSLTSVWLAISLLRVQYTVFEGVYNWGEMLMLLPLCFVALSFGMFFFRQPREKKMAHYKTAPKLEEDHNKHHFHYKKKFKHHKKK